MILKKKVKNFIFQFFDEILLLAGFKDERPQGLSWQSALKGYIPFYDKNKKNRVFGFLPCENGFWYYLRVRACKS